MDLLSVRLFARQLQGTHRRADDALFFLQLLAVAGANVPALGLPLLPVRLRLTAASGLLLCSAGVLLLCAAANARRFFALGCGAAPSDLRPLRRMTAFYLLLSVLRLGMALISALPTAALALLTRAWVPGGLTRRELLLLFCGTAAMALLSLWTFTRLSSLLFLAPYAYAGGTPARESLRRSVSIMAAQRRAARRFRRGFWGWFILCAALLPLPFVWGYYQQSAAVFARALLSAQQTADDQPTKPLDKWAESC